MRTTATPWQGVLLVALIAIALWPAGACSGGSAGRRESGVTLEVEPHHEGLVVLRSPTFR
jgi:hypothetical protein